jgi:mannose/fructose/N-acetylgalactosamine-specific phosphotransferase system component IIB
MSLVLARVDDRLIHGQVVGGWLPVIQAHRIVVASDPAAKDAFQVGLMRLAVPDHVALDVLTVGQVAEFLLANAWAEERVLLLLPGVRELARLVEAGVSIPLVNVGGLHDAPGRVLVAPHLAFTPAERTVLKSLVGRGMVFETRALPGDEMIPLEHLLPDLGNK